MDPARLTCVCTLRQLLLFNKKHSSIIRATTQGFALTTCNSSQVSYRLAHLWPENVALGKSLRIHRLHVRNFNQALMQKCHE